MKYMNNWIICICVTLVIATILSLLAPKSSSGKFYKTLVKLFVFLSFIYPFSQADFIFNKYDFKSSENIEISSEYELENANQVIRKSIIELLQNNDVDGVLVNVDSHKTVDDMIDVENITVIVPDEYDQENIKNLIFDNLSLNVDVIHIGQ